MVYLRSSLLGVCIISVLAGVWWLVLISGVARLVLGRSYTVLTIGLLLDILFIHTAGTPLLFMGFYTPIFLLTTVLVESVRARVLWSA